MSNSAPFKSDTGREKIRSHYNQILSLFPYRQIYLKTSFAATFVLEAGLSSAPAVILLHGSTSNSAAWLGDISRLAETFHVFACDLPGEPGNSEAQRLDINSGQYPAWLKQVLDSLTIERAVIIGNSLGGWLALHFAAAFPQRVSALALIAPSGLILPKDSFLERTASMGTDDEATAAVTSAILGDAKVPAEVLEFMTLILENFNPITGALPVLSDQALRSLDMPVLFLAGSGDITLDAAKAAQRLSRLVPQAQISLSEGGHLIMDQAPAILSFLTQLTFPGTP